MVDISVNGIEITQGIQTATNSIDLVAKRSTAVRATLGVTGSPAPVTGVTGRLHVWVDDVKITPMAGIVPLNGPFTAPITPDREEEDDTLNFELLAPTNITASNNVDFVVDIAGVPGETDTGNNSGSVNDLTFVEPITPNIFYTRINYTPAGVGLPDPNLVKPGVGDAFVRGIFPVNDADPNLYRQGLFPTLLYTRDIYKDGKINYSYLEGQYLLSHLALFRQLIVRFGFGANDNTYLYGWLAENAIDHHNGLAHVGGFNAYGNTDPIRYQRTFAHELGHNFGLGHNSRTLDPEVGWDVGGRLDGNPVTNNTTGRVKPTNLSDIMRGGQVTNSAWVDTITYNDFLNYTPSPGSPSPDILPDKSSPGSPSPDILPDRFSKNVLVIQGIFDPSGQKLVFLPPVFNYPWLSQASSRSQQGRYAVELFGVQGNVIDRVFFTPLTEADIEESFEQEESSEQFGFFEVMIAPPKEEVFSFRITDIEGKQNFGGFRRSQAPEISIVEPLTGSSLGGKTEVAWEVKDPDTPLEDLMYQIAYSPNDGENWVPIAVNIPGTENSIVFNSTEIQKSFQRGLIRVFVSDGLNTEFADVSGLTTEEAQYPSPDKIDFPFPIGKGEPDILNPGIDFNQDADWSYPGEEIALDVPVNSGNNSVKFFVPQKAKSPSTDDHFPLSSPNELGLSDKGYLPSGAIPTGEVEDYPVRIQPPLQLGESISVLDNANLTSL